MNIESCLVVQTPEGWPQDPTVYKVSTLYRKTVFLSIILDKNKKRPPAAFCYFCCYS